MSVSDTFYNSGEKKPLFKRIISNPIVFSARHKIQRIQRSVVNIFIDYRYIGDAAFYLVKIRISFIKALLDIDIESAKELYKEMKDNYPLVITRDFEDAKAWVRSKARGTERYGLLASSGAKRLRSEGIWVLAEINNLSWFLNDSRDVDSSYYLEVAASEFKVQGLEVDYSLVAWDANFRYKDGEFGYFRFMRSQWQNIQNEQNRVYLKNAYRVLLTRARQGMIIYVPKGNDNDPACKCSFYDGTFNYLKEIGIEEV